MDEDGSLRSRVHEMVERGRGFDRHFIATIVERHDDSVSRVAVRGTPRPGV